MNDIERIYSLLVHSNGLKIRDVSRELELDKYYVSEILFSPQNITYWYQDDHSLWFAKEGALKLEEPKEERDELTAPIEATQKFNIARFQEEDISDSLRSYLKQISKYRLYSNDDMLELFRRYRNGDKRAFDLIVKSQQRLVANIAFLYCRKGVPLEDIIQEGNMGLIRAVEKFDYLQYRSFSNYAKSWIFQSISIAMTTLPYMVRLPLNQLARYYKVRKFKDRFEQQNEYPPSLTDINIGDDDDLEKNAIVNHLPSSLLDLVKFQDLDFQESNMDLVVKYVDDEYNWYYVRWLLKRLKDREADILKLYFGIDAGEETLSSIGEKMYLTRERIRQILWSSVRKLQDISHVKREEAKIGEMIRIDSSNQLGRVINIKQDKDGTTVLVVKMGAGYTTEISVYDTPYHIVKNKSKKKSQSAPKKIQIEETRSNLPAQEDSKDEVKETLTQITNLNRKTNREAMVGDRIQYDSKLCTVLEKKTMGGSLRLIIKYDDGNIDNVRNDWNRYKVLSKNVS